MYVAPYALNWMAEKISEQPFRIGCHTGAPGVNGTENELQAGAQRNYQTGASRTELTAAATAAAGGITDNTANFVVFTPTTLDAGELVTHLSYWIGINFFGWVALVDAERTAENVPFTIAADTLAFEFLQFPSS